MIFSSNFFLYVFFPLVVILYFVIKKITNSSKPALNFVLLIFSTLFYLFGSGRYILVLLLSVLLNYIFGIIVEKNKDKKRIVIAIVINVLLLVWFKYTNFICDNLESVLSVAMNEKYNIDFSVYLPIGISFYTFQGLSYVLDVYKGTVKPQRNILKLALYICFFPQLIAGPIVRYSDVENDIDNRKESIDDFYYGICRFILGLSKKVLVADILAISVDKIFSTHVSELSVSLCWIGALLYTVEILFDFAGYSDMAIGMARMFGFHFQENFIMPYESKNITEFWRKWHISLSSFLKDYIYIPLGGNRCGKFKTYRNLFIIFLICGIWHGAAWNFVIWGMYHGALLIIERILRNKYNFVMKGVCGNMITFVLVMIGWVMFRADSLEYMKEYLLAMFGFSEANAFQYYTMGYYVSPLVLVVTIIGLVLSVLRCDKIRKIYEKKTVKGIVSFVLLILCMIYMSDASFNAFIYFKF
ncbi:MAG: MBOAT family protein [Lachnospiraceae bacterium]|nr:MBOAT family protein [Lachnospiraceae bacterium]